MRGTKNVWVEYHVSFTEVYYLSGYGLATIDKVGMNLWSRLATALVVVVRLSVAQTAPPSNNPPAIQVPVAAGESAAAQPASPLAPSSPPAQPAGQTAVQPSAQPAAAQTPATAPVAPVDVKPSGLALTTPEVPEALVPDPVRPAPQTAAPVATTAKSTDVTDEKKEKSTPGATSAGSAKPAAAKGDSARYILGANDVVSVSVWGDKNLTGTYTIGPDGRMSMSLIRDFKATGYTIPQLEDLITAKLKDFYNEPIVNVQLLRNNSKKYTLVGAVNKPGPYPLLQETTMLDAIAMAGGFRDFAKQTKVKIMRGKKTFMFNNKEVMKGQHMEQNITLEDGDIIFVPGE